MRGRGFQLVYHSTYLLLKTWWLIELRGNLKRLVGCRFLIFLLNSSSLQNNNDIFKTDPFLFQVCGDATKKSLSSRDAKQVTEKDCSDAKKKILECKNR